MRLIDADAFTNVLRKDKKYMRLLMSKETALVDVLSTVIDDLEGTGLDGYKNAPTVSAYLPTGEWEEISTGEAKDITLQYMRCSACKRWHIVPYLYKVTISNYCPHCGAKMQAEPSGGSGNSPKYAER